jgi:hypothetical protein
MLVPRSRQTRYPAPIAIDGNKKNSLFIEVVFFGFFSSTEEVFA